MHRSIFYRVFFLPLGFLSSLLLTFHIFGLKSPIKRCIKLFCAVNFLSYQLPLSARCCCFTNATSPIVPCNTARLCTILLFSKENKSIIIDSDINFLKVRIKFPLLIVKENCMYFAHKSAGYFLFYVSLPLCYCHLTTCFVVIWGNMHPANRNYEHILFTLSPKTS